MVNKLLVVAVMLLAAMSARAQIGYKGQVALGVSGGISNVGGFVGTARIGGYLSEHSILGAGMILDRTRYDATQGDSFHTSQWLGVIIISMRSRWDGLSCRRQAAYSWAGSSAISDPAKGTSCLTATSLSMASYCSATSSMSSAGIGLLHWSLA